MARSEQGAGDGARGAAITASVASLVLWGTEAQPVPADADVILWQGAARPPAVRSLTEYLDTHAQEVRRRYLAWSFEFGERRVQGRRLREHFRLADGTSFWWYSLFAEQSAWKQRSLEPMLKLMALELLLEREAPEQLSYAGCDADVDRVLRGVCKRHGIRYEWRRLPRPWFAGGGLRRALPRSLQGLLALAYFMWVRVALRPASRQRQGRGEAPGVMICGPFAQQGSAGQPGSKFLSRFWGVLPEILLRDGYQLQWLHYFHAHEQVRSAREARRLLRTINSRSAPNETHTFVESYLPLTGFVRLLARWTAIAGESALVGWHLRRASDPAHESYWPLIRHDWARAFRGFPCVESLFYAACFDKALRMLERREECIYVMENQGWERALAQAWHKHRHHGRLTGVAHSTVRFWDLRYHSDPRRYDQGYRELATAPDCVALNGGAARAEYLATCGVRERLADVEALRYLHLVRGKPRDLGELSRAENLRLLVLGDYTEERTDAMLEAARGVLGDTPVALEVLVKPHPSCPIDHQRYTQGGFRVVTGPVAELVPAAHLILASNTTSAALEAYVSGGRVLVFDDRSGVNYSPLKHVDGVPFIRNAEDLRQILAALECKADEPERATEGFFYIDPALPRWRRYFAARVEPLDRATPAAS